MSWQRAAVAASLVVASVTLTTCIRGSESPATAPGEVERRAEIPAGGRRLILIVVDGLDARDVGDESTPALARAWQESAWCPGAVARAAMPARTNVNHATLLTGVHPETHGIIGNAFWDRDRAAPRKLGAAIDLLTETLFTVARRTRPDLRTAVAIGKDKLALMFEGVGGQAAPDILWRPTQAPGSERDPVTGYAYDAATLEGVRGLLAAGDVAFMLVNLADIDRVSHGVGPHAPAAGAARRASDAAVDDLLTFLRERDDWPRTTVVITSDHGFDTIRHPAIAFGALAARAGLTDIVSVGDGGVGHVYLRAGGAGAESWAQLAAARRLALATPGIAEALYLAPNPADGGVTFTLAEAHADWHLVHPRGGDLLLVAAPGNVLSDGGEEVKLIGNHGAPAETLVPLIVVRDGARAADDCGAVSAADLGRTLFSCLELRDVERLDGSAIPASGRGRILFGLCL